MSRPEISVSRLRKVLGQLAREVEPRFRERFEESAGSGSLARPERFLREALARPGGIEPRQDIDSNEVGVLTKSEKRAPKTARVESSPERIEDRKRLFDPCQGFGEISPLRL